MIGSLARDGIQYAGYLLEFSVFIFLIRKGGWKRHAALALYVISFLVLDGIARPLYLYHYGFHSQQYKVCYWVTDLLLTLAAFLLIVTLFRRALSEESEWWQVARNVLGSVLLLVAVASYFGLEHNIQHLLAAFIAEFQQNLYFTCLVLNTILYGTVARFHLHDDELGLIVCGLGIQYAGPAANFALIHLTPGHQYFIALYSYIGPLSNVGMFLTWLYAVTRARRPALSMGSFKPVPIHSMGQ